MRSLDSGQKKAVGKMKKLLELNLEVKSSGAFIMNDWSLRGGAVAIHLKVNLDCFTSFAMTRSWSSRGGAVAIHLKVNLDCFTSFAMTRSWSSRGGAVAIHLKVNLDCFTSFAMTVGGVFLSDSEGYSSGQLDSSASPQNDRRVFLRMIGLASFGMISSFFCGELENNYLDEKTGMEILVSYILFIFFRDKNDNKKTVFTSSAFRGIFLSYAMMR